MTAAAGRQRQLASHSEPWLSQPAKGLHGLTGSGPGYSIVVLSNLAAADPDGAQAPAGGPGPGPAAGASGRAASRAGAAVLAGGTASVLALPGPFTSEANDEAEYSEPLPHQPLSQSGSPGPPEDDSPAEESGKNFTQPGSRERDMIHSRNVLKV